VTSYSSLARFYDSLTSDVPHKAFADFYEEIWVQRGIVVKTVLDLACGTGAMTHILASRGYDVIGVDSSPDMLSIAAQKSERADSPIFICQQIEALDLYGTVDAAVCALDGMNYVHPKDFAEAARRIHLFLQPDGVLIFDIHTPYHLRSLDGMECLDETDDVFCLWRTEFDTGSDSLHYSFDIFERAGDLWARSYEEHIQYAHKPESLIKTLEGAGFVEVRLFGASDKSETPSPEERRVFITARKGSK